MTETSHLEELIDTFVTRGGSDMYIVGGSKPSMKLQGKLIPLQEEEITKEQVMECIRKITSEEAAREFETSLEYNTAISWRGKARLRINMFQQRQQPGLVIRRINTAIPTLEELKLHPAYANLAMEKRGLVLVVGPTGSGKSTSLAAMVHHRNVNSTGHIVMIEDPVEFVHEHRGCIVSQRDIGIDTFSLTAALKNALRQAPDVLMIGEIRDAETMEHAINFSETGHLVFGTLHANNTNQAIERIINFFEHEKHQQLLLNVALNLRGIISQRLVPTKHGTRVLITEVMLNNGLIKNLIEEGKVRELREQVEKSRDQGMQTFDQALYDLVSQDIVAEDVAMAESDNPASLRIQFKQTEMQKKLSALSDLSSSKF